MQWQEIPQPLNIRPSERPVLLKPRQLVQYPIKLKKLPQWIDNATFQKSQNKNKVQNSQILINNNNDVNQKQNITQNNEIFKSLQEKYTRSQQFQLVYDRCQPEQSVNLNFAYQYIPSDFVQIQDQYHNNNNNQRSRSTNYSPRKKYTKNDDQIQFDSLFQCGNLSKVYKVIRQQSKYYYNEYHLLMQKDINTLGYTQWYCFSVKNNMQQKQIIQLQIVNFVKGYSLYKQGMKPWIISQGQTAWKPLSSTCLYKRTNVKNHFNENYYQLKFNVQIPTGVMFIAMMPIYSYSRLSEKIKKWENVKGFSLYQRKVYTILNNIVPILQYIPEKDSLKDQQKKWLDTLVFSARIHPGQVWSSFLIQQLIQNFISFHRSQSRKIRYIFIPMLNPDGVIYGNFRCDFSGVDLNRVWIDPNKYTQQSIFQIKKILSKQLEQKKAKYFIDFHSHSKCYNIFAYTCGQSILQARLVPDLIRLLNDNKIFDPISSIQDITQQFINQSQTTFISNKDIFYSHKKSTARAFISQLTKNSNTMTIQISFYGYYDKSQHVLKIFEIHQFSDFAWAMIRKLLDFLDQNDSVILAKKMLKSFYINQQKILLEKAKIASHLKQPIVNVDSDIVSDSDSQPQRYYTAQTNKKLYCKDNQNGKFKNTYTPNGRKKRYLQNTQSLLHRIQIVQKQKDISQIFHKAFQANDASRQMRNKNISFDVKKNHHKMKKEFLISSTNEEINEKMKLSQKSNQNLNKSKQIRTKVMVAQRYRDKRVKTQSSTNDKKIQQTQKIMTNSHNQSINSVAQPIDLSMQISKKFVPTFGKFLPSSKRNATNKYKIILKQQLQMQKRQNLLRQKCGMRFKSSFNLKQDDNRTQNNFIQQGTVILCHTKQQQNYNKIYKAKKKNTSVKIIAANTDKYILERKKLLDMMKKQTRFNDELKRELLGDDIEEIIEKRKRAHTETSDNYSAFKQKTFQGQKKVIDSVNIHDSTVSFNDTKIYHRPITKSNNQMTLMTIKQNNRKNISMQTFKGVITAKNTCKSQIK